jgi:hypothetical protein
VSRFIELPQGVMRQPPAYHLPVIIALDKIVLFRPAPNDAGTEIVFGGDELAVELPYELVKQVIGLALSAAGPIYSWEDGARAAGAG